MRKESPYHEILFLHQNQCYQHSNVYLEAAANSLIEPYEKYYYLVLSGAAEKCRYRRSPPYSHSKYTHTNKI